MTTTATIACAISYHNTGQSRLPRRLLMCGLTAASLLLATAGCSSPASSSWSVPVWQLAKAEPYAPLHLARGRISFDAPLPARLVQQLSPTFAMITVRKPADWQNLCRQLHIQPARTDLDLTQGVILGLAAQVGEPAAGKWPIQINYVRQISGEAAVDATFTPGIYYPLLTAAYVDWVYAPGIETVTFIRINHRQFVLQAVNRLN